MNVPTKFDEVYNIVKYSILTKKNTTYSYRM